MVKPTNIEHPYEFLHDFVDWAKENCEDAFDIYDSTSTVIEDFLIQWESE